VIYWIELDGDGTRVFLERSGFGMPRSWVNRPSEEPNLVTREDSSRFPAWLGALRAVSAAKS
jgi:hypothetical protein